MVLSKWFHFVPLAAEAAQPLRIATDHLSCLAYNRADNRGAGIMIFAVAGSRYRDSCANGTEANPAPVIGSCAADDGAGR